MWRSLADVPTSRHGFGGAVVGLENAAPVLHTVSGGWKQGFAHTTVHEVFRYDVCNASGECDDGNPCTVDSCNATGNCQNVPVGNGAACNDGLACTTDDQCNDGHCTGASTCAAGQFCSSSTGQCANPELVCIATGNDPDALFQGSMTKGPEFTGGADLDTAADSLTCPILYPDSTRSSPGGGSGDRVRFEDGSHEAVDSIIYATGYKISIPFLDRQHLNWRDGRPRLYLNVFHPGYDNLFFIGLIQPDSGQFGLVDYQSKLVASFIAGARTESQPVKDLRRVKAGGQVGHRKSLHYPETARNLLEVEHFSYRNELKRELARLRAA